MTFPILPSNAASGYQTQRSLRFNSADSAYLNRTPSVAGNRKTWTWSGWVKRSGLEIQGLFECGTATSNRFFIRLESDASLLLNDVNTGVTSLRYSMSNVFRDTSAWYHFVVAVDTTQAVAGNRVKVYVNNTSIALTTVNEVPQNYDTLVNSVIASRIGTVLNSSQVPSSFFNGYLTEVNFIDGQALDPSYFGATNATTGQWQPKAYSGSYGTNGFYLNFSDNSGTTATTLGKDYSGNGNNWTPNNFSVTAGTGNDSLIDVPTNWADGGNGRGNYCTLNPLDTGIVLSNGNLDYVSDGAGIAKGAIGVLSGKWYWECVPTGSALGLFGLVTTATLPTITYVGQTNTSWGYYGDGTKYTSGGASAYGSSFATNDVIGVAFDADAGTLAFYKNGTSQGTAFTGLIYGPYTPAVGNNNASDNGVLNFGQRPFAYTPPSGFKALNTQNIAAGTITTSGSFTGNVNADGPFVWLNGVPTAMTINGNAVTFGTHADKLANGFKVRTSSTSYNNTGSNTYSITTTGAQFKNANAQVNP